MLLHWPGGQIHGPCTDEWNLASTDAGEKEAVIAWVFIKCVQSVKHLSLILIETVGFWLLSGLAYFPSSVSALVVSDLMKLNWLHLIL